MHRPYGLMNVGVGVRALEKVTNNKHEIKLNGEETDIGKYYGSCTCANRKWFNKKNIKIILFLGACAEFRKHCSARIRMDFDVCFIL